MNGEEKSKWAILQLRQKYAVLVKIPRKQDFDAPTRSRIKAFLGPWPRALEAAGLKETRTEKQKRKEE